MRTLGRLPVILWSMLMPVAVIAQIEVLEINENEDQVVRWNRFVDDLYRLHQRLAQSRTTLERHRVGGYSRYPEFYDEVTTIDRSTGQVLSVIQWQREPPAGLVDRLSAWLGGAPWTGEPIRKIHSIAVNVYDDAGMLVRDYSATYLPEFRNAPIQTLVFLHDYRDGLHAFRSFDASGNRIYEACRGIHKGGKVDMDLDEDRIAVESADPAGIVHGSLYRFCFERIPMSAAEYLPPH